MVAFATVATIIASQAIISGAYSLTQQAMQLGFLPRMRVLHTASHEKGQIYMPVVNWLLAAGTLAAVLTFGSSDALGGAYGIAVSMLMAITTVLAALVALQWGYNPLAGRRGQRVLPRHRADLRCRQHDEADRGRLVPAPAGRRHRVPDADLANRVAACSSSERSKLRQREDEFVEWVLNTPPIRLPGAAAIFTAASTGIPLGLTHHLRHNRVLHERVLLISVHQHR